MLKIGILMKNFLVWEFMRRFDFSIFEHFDSYTNKNFRKSVCDIIDKKGRVTVDSNINPEKHKWDGSLTIHFPTPPSAQEIIKLLQEANNPNEFGMSNDKTLCSWWD